jgi:hypothetical protein
MFAQSLNTYATPVPTVYNSTLSSSFENAKLTIANGPNDLLTLLGNKATITADANATLVQNRDCTVEMPNTANRVVTLPSATGQKFPILIQKTSNNYFTITVNRASAPDTIDNPFASTTTPVLTSWTIYLPGEAYLFIPQGTNWRVVVFNFPVDNLRFRATKSVPQTIGAGNVKVTFNSDSGGSLYDLGSNFDTTNSRFVAPFDGIYAFTSVLTMDAKAVDTAGWFALNGTEVLRFSGRHNVNTPIDIGGAIDHIPMTTGQYMEVYVQANTRAIVENTTMFTGYCVSRT